MAEKIQRCAVYTRKSTEDGLEKEFNSLDAQYEACAAYALSQKHEGWELVSERYDDGGFSGGNMERPGLKRLMADVAAGKVDIILVYKIDRLTRSLADFAKIVDVLDTAKASFVSITQSFNTTTSMGRLTLNMLLSFAQFEREVKGEVYPGEHEAIVPEDLFQAVQDKLKANASGTSRRLKGQQPSLLTGILQDSDGRAMTPSHASKGKAQRYRYYVTRPNQTSDQPACLCSRQLVHDPLEPGRSAVRRREPGRGRRQDRQPLHGPGLDHCGSKPQPSDLRVQARRCEQRFCQGVSG